MFNAGCRPEFPTAVTYWSTTRVTIWAWPHILATTATKSSVVEISSVISTVAGTDLHLVANVSSSWQCFFFIFLPRNLVYITHVFSFLLFSLSTIPHKNSRVLSRTTHHQQRRFPALDQLNRSRHGGGILLLEQLTLSYVRPEPHRLSVGRPLRPRPTCLHRYVIFFFRMMMTILLLKRPLKTFDLSRCLCPKKLSSLCCCWTRITWLAWPWLEDETLWLFFRATEPHLVYHFKHLTNHMQLVGILFYKWRHAKPSAIYPPLHYSEWFLGK